MTLLPNFILASTSPRRRDLLSVGGWEFEVAPANVDETPKPGESPKEYTHRVAQSKARAVGGAASNGSIVIAADTTVCMHDRILGKPSDADEAAHMLSILRGNTHQVITSVAVYLTSKDEMFCDQAVTDVPMRKYSDAEMHAYIATGDPFDKAGSYAIQRQDFKPVDDLQGCYANVVGLPLCHLVRTLKKMGAASGEEIPQSCQKALDYECPVYERILIGEL
ncbi:MAG: septum formation protein Maf [Chloroflexi bacterium]|nr:septum formation protein Maf [Chloroflexota bacterium]